MTFAEFYGVDDILTVNKSIPELLVRYEDVFDWPEELPPKGGIEHHIHLKNSTNPINVRLYRYAYQQKEEMEKLVDEMPLG